MQRLCRRQAYARRIVRNANRFLGGRLVGRGFSRDVGRTPSWALAPDDTRLDLVRPLSRLPVRGPNQRHIHQMLRQEPHLQLILADHIANQ